jgi:hypothetical protein
MDDSGLAENPEGTLGDLTTRIEFVGDSEHSGRGEGTLVAVGAAFQSLGDTLPEGLGINPH